MHGLNSEGNTIQPWWLEIVAPGQWGEVVVEKGNEVIARLPYVLDKGKIEMPPLTQTLGPWMKPEIRDFLPGNKHLSNQKEIVSDLLGIVPWRYLASSRAVMTITYDRSGVGLAGSAVIPCLRSVVASLSMLGTRIPDSWQLFPH